MATKSSLYADRSTIKCQMDMHPYNFRYRGYSEVYTYQKALILGDYIIWFDFMNYKCIHYYYIIIH